MSKTRTVVLHQSLIRPILLAGAERRAVLILGVVVMALVFGIGSWQAAVLGIMIGLGGHWGLVQLAKKDTQYLDVFERQLYHQDYYPAQASHDAPPPIIKYDHI